MKKLLAAVLSALLLLSSIPASLAAESYPLLRNPVNPTFDGVITPEEWGEPDHVALPDNDALPEKVEYWWRYSDTSFLFAVRVYTDNFKPGMHDAGGSYLVPRIPKADGGSAAYLGLFSMTEEYELYYPHISNLSDGAFSARYENGIVEYEFSFHIPAALSFNDGDSIQVQLDYHEPKNTTVLMRPSLVIQPAMAEVAAPAETEPAETEPAETEPTETEPAETDPAGSAPADPADPADPPKENPSALPALLIGAAVAVIAVGAVTAAVLKKKKK